MKAAVIGCGMIGGGLDTPDDHMVLTHAHGYLCHESCKLVACVDTNDAAIERFRNKWGKDIRGYNDVRTMLECEKPEVVSICTPTSHHASNIKTIYNYPFIRAVLCEKPLVDGLNEFFEVERLIKNSSKVFAVNYIRCFDPSHLEALSVIQSNILGIPLGFYGVFTKGLYHNGSHLLSFIENLFGVITEVKVLDGGRIGGDLYGAYVVKTSCGVTGTLFNTSGDRYSVFELDVILESGRIKFIDLGRRIEIYEAAPSKIFAGYRELMLKRVLPDTLSYYGINSITCVLNLLRDDTRRVQLISRQMDFSRRLLNLRDRL
ncbi:MAG: Gfo/Idh/MocA family oxidoreductase [Dissulfuribacterales bacterium]